MSEAQKYQGALYKEKPTKGQKKAQNGQSTPNQKGKGNANANKQPRVEDASDGDYVKAEVAPPPAPTPPPAGEGKATSDALTNGGKPINVFDYLVTDETPNASKVTLVPKNTPKEQMSMVTNAKSVFEPSTALAKLDTKTDDEGHYDVAYEENGFSYGAGPIPPSMYPKDVPNVSTEFVTPAPKKTKKERRKEEKRSSASGSEKKRKRGQEQPSSPQPDMDTPMLDAPSSVINNAGTPVLAHSGLTGGLNRMMRSPSPDDSPDLHRQSYHDTSSPIKRSRRNGKETKESTSNGDAGLGISIKSRAERLVTSMFGGSVISTSSAGNDSNSRALVRTRRGSSSSADGALEIRKKKSHRSRHASDSHTERKAKRKSSNPMDADRPSRRQKHSDERRRSDSRSPHRERQVTVYRASKPPARSDDVLQREMAVHFLSLVGSRDSERGCSVHKALKRFHRDFEDEGDFDRERGRSRERRVEDEKDLWRALRLRRNERGEIVVYV
jgi:cell growth-regulating nucleolar protein